MRAKPQRHQVLDHLLAQVVVYAVDLVLGEQARQVGAQPGGRGVVVPKRLFDDHPRRGTRVGGHARRPQVAGDRLEHVRRQGQVEEAVRGHCAEKVVVVFHFIQ